MTPPDLADVLAEVNRLRAERGMEPLSEMPKGTNAATSCPLARALEVVAVVPGWIDGHEAGSDSYYLTDDDKQHPLPAVLGKFGRAFDSDDAYPELYGA